MESLFPGAVRFMRLMAGPEPFKPSGRRLRALDPYSLPSRRLIRYIRDVTGKDLEPALDIAGYQVKISTAEVQGNFPRIPKYLER